MMTTRTDRYDDDDGGTAACCPLVLQVGPPAEDPTSASARCQPSPFDAGTEPICGAGREMAVGPRVFVAVWTRPLWTTPSGIYPAFPYQCPHWTWTHTRLHFDNVDDEEQPSSESDLITARAVDYSSKGYSDILRVTASSSSRPPVSGCMVVIKPWGMGWHCGTRSGPTRTEGGSRC